MKKIVSLLNIHSWVDNFLTNLAQKKEATIVCLSGEVGVGKTTITQHIGSALGIEEVITSPTFVIQKEYIITGHAWIKKMIHIDAYRLDKKEDLEYLGWHELIVDPEVLIIIEWPEMVPGLEMPETIHLHLDINKDYSRTITKTIS